MNPLDLRLYELLGDKTLSTGTLCENGGGDFFIWTKEIERIYRSKSFVSLGGKIVGKEPTIFDLHRWLEENFRGRWMQELDTIAIHPSLEDEFQTCFEYVASKSLLDQSDYTKRAIMELIEATNSK